MRKQTAFITIVLVTAAMAIIIAGSAAAGPPVQPPGVSGTINLAGSVASKISYQGRLTDAAGNPLDGNHNLVFQLWDDPAGGSQVGGDIVRNNVPVSDGAFTVELEVNAAEFSGEGRWLRVQVDGQWLSPRQELLPVPYALSLRPGAGIAGEVGFSGALNVSNSGAGQGLLATAGPVLFDAMESQIGVFGAGRDGGVMGFADGEDKFGGAFSGDGGVSGSGQAGPGGSFTSTGGPGLAAYSESNPAVEATSSEDVAVYATTGTIPLILIQGKQAVVAYGEQNGVIAWGGETGGSFEGSTGVKGTGGLRGVHGLTESGEEGAAGVLGEATGLDGAGVRGTSALGPGVVGTGEIGVIGTSSVAVGVKGEGPGAGVEGFSETGDGVVGRTAGGTNQAAVRGEATGTSFAGHFTSNDTVGVFATGREGVHGEDTSGTNPGVHGVGASVGVHGEGSIGVKGTSTAGDGVEGRTESGSGVVGVSTHGDGVVGNSQTGIGVYANSGGEAAVKGEGPKGVYGRSSADGGEGVHGHGSGSHTEGVLGTSDNAAGVYGISSGSEPGLAVGVRGQTDATWGLATNENLFVGGSCTGCTLAFVAQNADAGRLEVGDVVSVVGIAPPLKGQQAPVLKVRRATAADGGVLGVVQARAVVDAGEMPASDSVFAQTKTIEMPGMAPGHVASGEHLFIVVQGLARVQVDASTDALQVGDPVGPGIAAGAAQKMSSAESTTPLLGRALEPLDQGTGLIWVLILGR